MEFDDTPSGMIQIGILGSGVFHTLCLAFLQPPFTILFLISMSDCKIALRSCMLSFSSKCPWDISGHFMPISGIVVIVVYQWPWLKIAVAVAAATSCKEGYCFFEAILHITEH